MKGPSEEVMVGNLSEETALKGLELMFTARVMANKFEEEKEVASIAVGDHPQRIRTGKILLNKSIK